MSGRKLPHRMTAVIRSLTTARDTYLITRDPDDRILSGEQWSKLDDANPQSFFSRLLQAQRQVQIALADQGRITVQLLAAAEELRLFISHFHQVLDLGILRRSFGAGARAYYGRDVSGQRLPALGTYDALETAADKIVAGEAARQTAEGAAYRPMSLPSAAEVADRLGPFRALRTQSGHALTRSDLQREALAGFLPEAKALAKDIAQTAAFAYRKDPDASSRRAKCRRWGVVYRESKKAVAPPDAKPGE